MAESSERPGSSDADPIIVPPPAMAMALATAGAALDPKVREYLDEQIALTRLQATDLRREDRIRHWSLRVRHVSDVMKLAFEVSAAIILVTIVVFLGAAIWSAANDNSLVIDAFNVPKDMEERGLTGQVVAAQLQDKLAAMQDATDSARPAASYANNWGNDIKVEIPNTGISIGEFYRYLAKWLGHQTHITGEVYRTETGIAVTARTGDDGATVTGATSDLDTLLQQAAEKIYERTQPYRYSVFLQRGAQPQFDRPARLLQKLAADGSPVDRIWAYVGLSALYGRTDPVRSAAVARAGAALKPDLAAIQSNVYLSEILIGHDEVALAAARITVDLLQNANGELTERARKSDELDDSAAVAFALGDSLSALRYSREAIMAANYNGSVDTARQSVALALAMLHEPGASRATWRALPPPAERADAGGRALTQILLPYWVGDWRQVLAERAEDENAIENAIGSGGLTRAWADVVLTRDVWPYVATAMAMTGDLSGARALIEKTPLDCYTCVRARADIAAAAKEWKTADYWFARAVDDGPSLPIGYSDWGRVLMLKGDLAGAIAKFEQANEKGPHFADPLEMWGEALLAQKNYGDAADKFEAANEFAPHWGRLHLKWGEALAANGDRAAAINQFTIASALDLSQPDRVELARMRPPHG